MEETNPPTRPDEFALEDFLPYRLSLLTNTVSEGVAQSYRKAYGLSVTEWRVVAVLGRYPGATASEIVKHTAMDKVTVSRAVRKLLDRGLVERTARQGDRRRQPLRLTGRKGRSLYRRIVPQALDYERRLLESLSAGDRSELKRLLDLLQARARHLRTN